jgi:hypothetical protein
MAALTGVAAMAVLEMLERELRVFDRYAPWIRLSAEYGYLTTTFPRKEVRICPLCALGNVERKSASGGAARTSTPAIHGMSEA